MNQRTVLISGASIAGPALAYWLHHHGFTVTVVERAAGPRPGGQAVDLRGAGREVIERMGLLPRVRQDSVDERGFALVNRNGDRVASMPAAMFGGEGIVAEIEIMRGDLTRILYEATRDRAEYIFGDQVTRLTQDTRGVRAHFASGAVRDFDLVVGADGVHSGVRALAFGPESDYVRGLGAYTAYFTVPDPGDLDQWFLMYNAPGGRVAGLRPERGGTAKASLFFRSPPLTEDRGGQRRQREILAGVFAGAGWRVPALLRALPGAPDFYFDAICQVHVGRWWCGRVALVGDAAYCGSPLTGLGTSMALAGAYVLAGELASASGNGNGDGGATGDYEKAFARYQDEMRAYVADCQRLPPGGVQSFAPRSRLMISLRALSMRTMTAWPVRGLLARQFEKADRLTLKKYERSTREVRVTSPGTVTPDAPGTRTSSARPPCPGGAPRRPGGSARRVSGPS